MNIAEEIDSPLARQSRAKFVSVIPSTHIIEQYRKQFDLDVSDYFEGIPQISIYECIETGYRFYHPASLAGRDSLYRHLGRFPWFYQEDKWEHAVALDYLRASQKVLDIGCGTGNFLFAAKQKKGAEVTGIEFNQDSAQIAREKGLDVVSELLEDHARSRPGYYDAVCTFQVLEHIPATGSFITNCIDALKPRGLFVVGVPNNDAFLKYADAVLNCPPHHMGLWTRKSLAALPRLFPIEILSFEIEPLNVVDWYQSVMERRYLPKRWMRSLFHRLGGAKIFRQYVAENANSIAGHTIMAIYRKLDHARTGTP